MHPQTNVFARFSIVVLRKDLNDKKNVIHDSTLKRHLESPFGVPICFSPRGS